MKTLSERAYRFRGTHYHLSASVDPDGLQKPVLLVQDAKDNPGPPVAKVRAQLAEHLAGRLDLKPEQVRWIERTPRGATVEYEIRPAWQGLSGDEHERAVGAGGQLEKGRPRYYFIAQRTTATSLGQPSNRQTPPAPEAPGPGGAPAVGNTVPAPAASAVGGAAGKTAETTAKAAVHTGAAAARVGAQAAATTARTAAAAAPVLIL